MQKSLIIVESPAKIKTLKNFLGNNYEVLASMGHVRDLPKNKLGVLIDKDFEPEYIKMPERRDIIAKLKIAAENADIIYLASDPDREGEAIAWHLQEILKASNAKRITFNEITKSAVIESLKNPTTINMDLINAQQARRILDRLVGYKLSPLLWSKIQKKLSAGRVQSVAVRLVCDREKEIDAFISEEYWDIKANLKTNKYKTEFEATLISHKKEKLALKTKDETDKIISDLNNAKYIVTNVEKSVKQRRPALPFVTSSLQQEAARKLGFTSKKTMSIAQQLYEGVELENGATGLITYMRTDSTRISEEAQKEVKGYILDNYGDKYIIQYKQKNKGGAQDAHEAIRPTSILRTPKEIKEFLMPEQYKLYKLIWQRFLAAMMAPAKYNITTALIDANEYQFRSTGSTLVFEGFTKVYTEGKDDNNAEDSDMPPLPNMSVDEILNLLGIKGNQHFTQPPARYTEATLVKALETNGIGRPSTYSTIISTIQDRKYTEIKEKKFYPTKLGVLVTDKLSEYIPLVMDIKFTADVEKKLDIVEEGKLNWVDLLRSIYKPFEKQLTKAKENMEKVKIEPTLIDEACPTCGKPLCIRNGRYGEFIGCSDYPKCTFIRTIQKTIDIKCPKCKDGNVIEKMSKRRKIFYGCDKYPKCDFVSWYKPTNLICPECNSLLGEWKAGGKLTGYKCTNNDCKYKEYLKKKEQGE